MKPTVTSRDVAAPKRHASKCILQLFVTGSTPKSTRAVTEVKQLCEAHLKGRYTLEVVDIYQQTMIGKEIIATPTLMKILPLPMRKYTGDMSNSEQVLHGLGLRPL